MGVLVIGLLVFLGVHSVRVLLPGWRGALMRRLGEQRFKGLYALASAIGLGLIIWGFARASADPIVVYTPHPGLRSVTAVLMLVALILALASNLPAGRIKRSVRHPLLIGTIMFAVAHLISNGDLAGVLLFGGFLLWALMTLVNSLRRVQPAVSSAPPALAGDAGAILGGLVLYGLFVWRLHLWLFGVAASV
jgi:uncharacterized membrane protein